MKEGKIQENRMNTNISLEKKSGCVCMCDVSNKGVNLLTASEGVNI